MGSAFDLTAFILDADGARTELHIASPTRKPGTEEYSCRVYAPALLPGEKFVIGVDPGQTFRSAVQLVRTLLAEQRVVDLHGNDLEAFAGPQPVSEVDDGRRAKVGVVACLVDDEQGTRLVLDDVVRDSDSGRGSWRFERLYTWKSFSDSLEDALCDEDLKLIGENIVFRLLALRKFQD